MRFVTFHRTVATICFQRVQSDSTLSELKSFFQVAQRSRRGGNAGLDDAILSGLSGWGGLGLPLIQRDCLGRGGLVVWGIEEDGEGDGVGGGGQEDGEILDVGGRALGGLGVDGEGFKPDAGG